MVVVYKITNIINNKIYIGVHRTDNLNDNYYGSGKLMKRALTKYGIENFKREYLHIYEDDDFELAFEKEKEYVTKEFTLREDTYNLSEGGNINPVLHGENNPFYGKTHTKETIDKIQKNRSWYITTEAHRKKLSEISKKNWQTEEYRNKCIQSAKNKDKSYITEEYKNKISIRTKGRKVSDEVKQKLSDLKKGISWGNHTEESKQKIREKHLGKECKWVAEITNKNPEKIKKTAEKHRGMKRSEEAKRNMSEAQKKRNRTHEIHNKGKIVIHNPKTKVIVYIDKNDIIPDGFILGGLKTKNVN